MKALVGLSMFIVTVGGGRGVSQVRELRSERVVTI